MNSMFTILASSSRTEFMRPALLVLILILSVLIVSCIFFTTLLIRVHKVSKALKFMLGMIYAVTIIVLASTVACFVRYASLRPVMMQPNDLPPANTIGTPETQKQPDNIVSNYQPASTKDSDPNNWNIKWDIMQNGTVKNTYQRNENILFGNGDDYSAVDGITTFRSNNYRSGSTYGTTNIITQALSQKWSAQLSTLENATGCGWTSQPLIVRWDADVKASMNLFPEKKQKENLVEVIYATRDGYIYFYDLDDGSYTREPIYIGMSFSCSGSLDPRGYPLLYLGAGLPSSTKVPRIFIVSLIDGSVLYEQSGSDIDAYRREFAFYSAPLISAEADTLIWSCESGILYTIKLNTKYNQTTGAISVSPENVVKVRYSSNTERDVGFESSPVIVENHLYFTDLGGMCFCVDLNTMKLKWAQNLGDAVCATPTFERIDDKTGYLYLGTTAVYNTNACTLFKLDAITGEIIWQRNIDNILTRTASHQSNAYGGLLASPVLGEQGTALENIVIFNIACTDKSNKGTLMALDTITGNAVWESTQQHYSYSSPTIAYTANNDAYLVHCNSAGKIKLQNAVTGAEYTSLILEDAKLATPAIFENTIVVGSQDKGIYAINIE